MHMKKVFAVTSLLRCTTTDARAQEASSYRVRQGLNIIVSLPKDKSQGLGGESLLSQFPLAASSIREPDIHSSWNARRCIPRESKSDIKGSITANHDSTSYYLLSLSAWSICHSILLAGRLHQPCPPSSPPLWIFFLSR